jgi:hypothetical protein
MVLRNLQRCIVEAWRCREHVLLAMLKNDARGRVVAHMPQATGRTLRVTPIILLVLDSLSLLEAGVSMQAPGRADHSRIVRLHQW